MIKHTMKKGLLIVLVLSAALLCCGCSDGGNANKNTLSQIPKVLNQAEYVLYQNVFYNGYGESAEGSTVTKNGVFAVVQDAFNGCTRYYVWGYMDNTLCCDWQWEIVPASDRNLPAPGSLVTVNGVFTKADGALDGYWIKDAQITVDSEYTGPKFDLNMQAMSDTLERVQVLNIMNKQEQFEGKTYAAYGRVSAVNMLEDPYYGAWQISFSLADASASPAIGTNIDVTGKITSGMLGEAVVTARN